MSDEKHEEIHRLNSCLKKKNPRVFEPLLFSKRVSMETMRNK